MSRILTTFALNPERTIVHIEPHPERERAGAASGADIGGGAVAIIAGPTVIESRAELIDCALALRASGGSVFRAATYRPLRSAHSLHGLALDGLEFLAEAREVCGLPVATEVVDPRDVEHVASVADLLVIGEGSMQNRALLAEVGRSGQPVVIERALAATLDQLLDAAEHVMSHGNPHVVLCERGIRTFEPRIPAALDISAIPLLRSLTHLPIIVAPGEACMRSDLVAPLTLGAIAAGADGVMLDLRVAATAPTDREPGATLGVEDLGRLIDGIRPIAAAAGRTVVDQDSSLHPGTSAHSRSRRPAPGALAALRSGIEQVDRRIIELIGQRVELARGAGKVKRTAGLPVIDEAQEHEVLARVRALAEGAGLPYEELRALQAYLIEISRRAQTHPEHPSPGV